MRRTAVFLAILLTAGAALALAQEAAKPAKAEESMVLKAQGGFVFDPQGRRDPFRDLLGGRDVKEQANDGQVYFEDLILKGIVKGPTGYTAILGTTQGFPFFVHVGDKFSDGYVVSIEPTKITYRLTHERGLPLMRPKDVVKEITPEER